MGLVTLTNIADGDDASGTVLDSNLDALAAAINGGIEDANFGASSPVVVATSVAGLGTTRDGKIGLIRAGSTPFWFQAVIYDATYGKWVSAAEVVIDAMQTIGAATTTSYTDLALSYISFPTSIRGIIPAFKALYDAGLRPQFRLDLSVSGDPGKVSIALEEWTDLDSAGSSICAANDSWSVTTTGSNYVSSGWLAPTVSAPSEQRVTVRLQAKKSSGTGLNVSGQVRLRWVSA